MYKLHSISKLLISQVIIPQVMYKLHSISKLLISQVIIPQVMYKLHSISKLLISKVTIPPVRFYVPINVPRALHTGTCIRQGDLFYSAGLYRNHVLATANTGEVGRGFGKMRRMGRKGRNKRGRNPWQYA